MPLPAPPETPRRARARADTNSPPAHRRHAQRRVLPVAYAVTGGRTARVVCEAAVESAATYSASMHSGWRQTRRPSTARGRLPSALRRQRHQRALSPRRVPWSGWRAHPRRNRHGRGREDRAARRVAALPAAISACDDVSWCGRSRIEGGARPESFLVVHLPAGRRHTLCGGRMSTSYLVACFHSTLGDCGPLAL